MSRLNLPFLFFWPLVTIDYPENSYLILTGPPCINQNTLSACDIKPTQISFFGGGRTVQRVNSLGVELILSVTGFKSLHEFVLF